MKLAKLILGTVAVSAVGFMLGCSSSKSSASSGPNCTHQPKLTKSCLEGTWTASSSDTSFLHHYVKANAALANDGLATDVENGSVAMAITFVVKSGDENNEIAVDSVYFNAVNNLDATQSYTGHGHFAFSADSTSIILHLGGSLGGDLSIDSTVVAKVSADSTGAILDLGARINTLFSGSNGYKTAELFYRAGNSIKGK